MYSVIPHIYGDTVYESATPPSTPNKIFWMKLWVNSKADEGISTLIIILLMVSIQGIYGAILLLQSFILTRISTPALHADAAGLLKVSETHPILPLPPTTYFFLSLYHVVSLH